MFMNMNELIVTLFIALPGTILIILLFSRYKKEKEVIKKLLAYFPGSVPSFFSYDESSFRFNGEYQGIKFSISCHVCETRGAYLDLTISLNKNYSFWLEIDKETTLSKMGKKVRKKLGLSKIGKKLEKKLSLSRIGKKIAIRHQEVKINDEMFDREFLIFSNNHNFAVSYLANMEIKNVIRELFNRGFDNLYVGSKEIGIRKTNYKLARDLEPIQLINILQKLSLLAKLL